MNIYHRQLYRRFLRNLTRAVAGIMVVMVSVGASGVYDELAAAAPSSAAGLRVIALMLLAAFDTALPLALLLATLFTVGTMARHQELTAWSAAGGSLASAVRPLIVVAVAAVLLSWGLRASGVLPSHAPEPAPVSGPMQLSMPLAPSAAAQTAAHAGRAFPLVNLFAVLVGIVLASTPRRHSIYVGFGRALLILLFYNLVTATALALGRHGGLPPVLAGWSGSIVFVCGLGLLWRRAKR